MSRARKRFARYRIRDDGPYADAEWDEFIRCARKYSGRPDVLHKDVLWKMEERGISERRLLAAVNKRARVAACEHHGDENSKRLWLWSPEHACLIIASREDGLILSVIEMPEDRFAGYAAARQNANFRWLRP